MAPPTAIARLRKSKPDTLPNPSWVPMNPPTNAPATPSTVVTMIPPGALPGMRNLANPPATSPSTIHEAIPIRFLQCQPQNLLPHRAQNVQCVATVTRLGAANIAAGEITASSSGTLEP